MNKKEALFDILRGNDTPFLPWALWQHFPEIDLDPEKHAQAIFEFFEKYDFLFAKITPPSGLFPESFGARLSYIYPLSSHGTRTYLHIPVQSKNDWNKIKMPKPDWDGFRREYRTVAKLREKVKKDVVIIQTIFSPITVAYELSGNRFFDDLFNHTKIVFRTIDKITQVICSFARESKKAGCDGLFFAIKLASGKYLEKDDYFSYGLPYDLEVLNTLRKEFDFILLHLHGEDIYWDIVSKCPVDAVNWHCQETRPSLIEAKKTFKGGLVGGLDAETLACETRNVIAEETRALMRFSLKKHILSTECVALINTPEENLFFVKNLLRESLIEPKGAS